MVFCGYMCMYMKDAAFAICNVACPGRHGMDTRGSNGRLTARYCTNSVHSFLLLEMQDRRDDHHHQHPSDRHSYQQHFCISTSPSRELDLQSMAPLCIQSNARKVKPESLWTQYFKDPSQWWSIRNSKARARSPDLNHKVTAEALWLDCRYNPTSEELRKTEPMSTLELSEGEPQEQKGAVFPEETAHVVGLLKACAKQKDLSKGTRLHEDICKRGLLEGSPYVASTLITMYAKCGALAKAQQVLDEHAVHDKFSWAALIAGYTQNGHGDKALKCFDKMQHEGHFPNLVTFACALKACASVGALDKGKQIHDETVRLGWLEKYIVLGNALVDMYAKCGALAKAQEVLDGLPVQEVVTWNALIAGYAKHGQGKEALICFEKMRQVGHSPTAVSFICALKACANVGTLDKGEQICDEIVRLGWLGRDVVLGNAMVDMFAKCGAFAKAWRVLDQLPVRDVVSWSALIAGYAKHGQGKEALKCFDKMQHEGHSPTAVTFTCALKACASVRALNKGEQIHDEIVRLGLLEKNIVLGNALVDMYAKCGVLAKAREVLDELPVRDVVSWSALIAGYAKHGQGKEALKCFDKMRHEGHFPTAVTFICALKACADVGAVVKGEEIHDEINRLGWLERESVIGNSVVNMYAKCGAFTKAREVFDELPVRDVVSWSALIAGYASHGCSADVLDCLEQMQCEGVSPNPGTFVCVLNACSHSGLLDEGQMYFTKMSAKFGVTPDVQHHCCMVDLFGRAGEFKKALTVIEMMPSSDYLPLWMALLGACRKWKNVRLGRLAFDRILQIDRTDASAYICMANIYAAAGMQEDAGEIEVMRISNKAQKKPRCCWSVDATGNTHCFLVGDKKHPQSKCIYKKLQHLTEKEVTAGLLSELGSGFTKHI